MLLPISDFGSGGTYFFLLFAAVLYFVYSARSWYRLRQFDGPWLAKHSYIWLVGAVTSNNLHVIFPEIHKKYGTTVRIGPNDLVTNDVKLLQRMSAARSTYSRSNWYKTQEVDTRAHSLFTDTNSKSHDLFKSYMASAYSGKDVPSLESDIDEIMGTFVDVIRRDHLSTNEETKIVDFASLCTYFTMDSITKFGFGKELGYLEHNADQYGYTEAVQKMLPLISIVSVMPLAVTLLSIPFVKAIVAPNRKDKKGIGKLLTLADRTADEALNSDIDTRRDMIASWLRRGYPRDKKRLSADIVLQLVAGGDSTATVIKTTTLYLISHYRVLRKLRTELDQAELLGQISSPIANKESLQLPYLQAVVKEGLRIFVPGHPLLIKQAPPEGDVIDGKRIPGGTRIAHSQWSQQRDPIYGSDPDLFRPERWLEAEPGRRSLMEKQLDTSFGVGRWGCLGKPIAWMELNKVFVELFRRYDFEVLNPTAPLVALPHSIFIVKDMYVRITEREK